MANKLFHVTQLAPGLGREAGPAVLSPVGYAQLASSSVPFKLDLEEDLDGPAQSVIGGPVKDRGPIAKEPAPLNTPDLGKAAAPPPHPDAEGSVLDAVNAGKA